MSRANSVASTSSSLPGHFSPHFVSRPSSYGGSDREQAGAFTSDDSDADEDEDAWDEVDVTHDPRPSAQRALDDAEQGISIVISKGGDKKGKGKKKGPSDGSVTRERMLRQERHKVHAAAHLAVGLVRSRWCSDQLLKSKLLSIVPLHLQNAFVSFNAISHPNERDRSRLFDRALKDLLSWWYQYFDIIPGGIVRRRVSEVEKELQTLQERAEAAKKSKGKKKAKLEDDGFTVNDGGGERVTSSEALYKFAKKRKGTRDVSAQLFTAICRALDIPARLVFSLQPIDWRPEKKPVEKKKKKKPAAKGKGVKKSVVKGKVKVKSSGSAPGTSMDEADDSDDDEDDAIATDGSWEDPRGRLGYKVPQVNLRRSKPKVSQRSPSPDAQARGRAPVFWTEVYARANREWITVDPSRKRMRCRGVMEPSKGDIENQLLYVVAFEEDGTVRDVTPRYAKQYQTTTLKARVPSRRGTDFVTDLLGPYLRTFKLNRDRTEDEELGVRVAQEPMPSSVAGFKNHPTYVLEQHLKRDEVLAPGATRLGTFRGSEAVYPRSAVIPLKSVENYWRVGRVLKDGEEPMKMVKGRVVTIRKKREEAALQLEGGEPDLQPLYSEKQTKIYVPPPVVDGKIPKNDFGNIDLFVPSMLPAGAVHIPNKGAAKAAKLLGLNYADAIIGFEFRQRRALPTLQGVVVAEEVAEALIETIINTEDIEQSKESAKRQDRALARWKKLILGLRIRQRLQASYKTADAPAVGEKTSQFASTSTSHSASEPAPSASTSTTTNGKNAAKLAVKVEDFAEKPARPKRLAASAAPSSQSKRSTASSPVAAPPTRTTRASAASSAVQVPEEVKRSSTGRSLRFTMSTEQAADAKDAKLHSGKKRKADLVLSDTDDDEVKLGDGHVQAVAVGEDEGGSDNSLELLSDF